MPKDHLPKFIQSEATRHGKVVYYFRRGRGCRIRMSGIPGSSVFDFHYARLISDGDNGTALKLMKTRIESHIKDCVVHAKKRDNRKGNTPATITREWAVRQIRVLGYRCAVTGIAFHLPIKRKDRKERVAPFAPSLDRIDNSKGYVDGNVRIVIAAFNMMRLDWGDDIFETVIEGYMENKTSRTNIPILPHLISEQVLSMSYEQEMV